MLWGLIFPKTWLGSEHWTMSQIMHFCGVKFWPENSGSVKKSCVAPAEFSKSFFGHPVYSAHSVFKNNSAGYLGFPSAAQMGWSISAGWPYSAKCTRKRAKSLQKQKAATSSLMFCSGYSQRLRGNCPEFNTATPKNHLLVRTNTWVVWLYVMDDLGLDFVPKLTSLSSPFL